MPELQEHYDGIHWRSAKEWVREFRDGEVAKLLNQVTAFNVAVGAFSDPLPAETYFDPSLLEDVLAQG